MCCIPNRPVEMVTRFSRVKQQARVPARSTKGAPAIAALDEAWHQVAAEIVHWTSDHLAE
jgi:ABC-type uncharacterized transport system auxiliary subunit